MKRLVTKASLISFMNTLDTRAKRLDPDQVDYVINNGFAELCTVANPFVADVTKDLTSYYELGETSFTINLPADVNEVYDLYLVYQDQEETLFTHGEMKIRDENRIWRDPKDLDIVHVDLTVAHQGAPYNLAVVKYFYVPTADFDELYISNDVYIALESAVSSALFSALHDVEKSGQMRAQFTRQVSGILNPYPEDYLDPGKPSMFPAGT